MNQPTYVDCHCHIFNFDCVPPVFRDRYSKNMNPTLVKALLTVFNNWFDNDDIADRVRNLLKKGMSKNISDIVKLLLEQHPDIN